MSGQAVELVDLVARWIHLIAGIMWIGNSLLYNWLDRNLETPVGSPKTPRPVGTIWLLHSGGFYYVEKTLLGGAPLPARLHWFRWQAYTTWLSGVALLLVVYYFGGRAVLSDGSTGMLSHTQAIWAGVVAVVGGWALYESMQRFVAPRAPRIAIAVWVSGLCAIAFALTRVMNGHAAFLHVGAMLGTIMAANVALTIVPSQRLLVASVGSGQGGDPAVSARAKRVSIHNNYFTFPVIVLMLSGHFPALYGGFLNWLVLLILVVGGAGVRHILNVRFAWPRWKWALTTTIAATVAGLYGVLQANAPRPEHDDAAVAPVTFAEARHVIDRRCGSCHSAHPSDVSLGVTPAGVMFDTPEQIVALAPRIRERAVVTRTMPAANRTMITEEERALLGRWVIQGARLDGPH